MPFVHSLVMFPKNGSKGWCAPVELGEAAPHYVSFVIPVNDNNAYFDEYICETVRLGEKQQIESHELVKHGKDSFLLQLGQRELWFTAQPGSKADRRLPYVGGLSHEDFQRLFTEIEPEEPDEVDRIFDKNNVLVIGCEPFKHYAGMKGANSAPKGNLAAKVKPGVSPCAHPIRRKCDLAVVRRLCNILIENGRGKTLAVHLLAELSTGYISEDTYRQLSRWCNPARAEPAAQPIAQAMSKELFGSVISRTP
jgi:hypothetical protein